MGNTLYIGSLQSEVYVCIYEKDYEQYKKHDIPSADAEVKNRFEIRLKNERAFYEMCIRDRYGCGRAGVSCSRSSVLAIPQG